MGDEEISFELGDTVLLSGGKVDGLRGRIYYIDDDLIRILPDGHPNKLEDIKIIDGDLDPSLDIEHLYSISKRTNPAFVAQINAQVGEIAETFTAEGLPGPVYTIKAIDENNDSILMVDSTGADTRIEFEFRGIPQDENFAILRPRQATTEEGDVDEYGPASISDEQAAAQAAAEEQEEGEFRDLMENAIGEIREIALSERTYPDNIQRNDMLQDMISALDPASQKNPERQKEIRLLVEQFINLRNSILTYNRSGEPSGKISTSYLTLIDLLEAKDVPLSRIVMKAKRVLYLDHTPEALREMEEGRLSSDPSEIPGLDVDILYLQDVVNETVKYMDEQLGGIQSQNLSADSLPEWYLSWQTLNKTYHSTWSIESDEVSKPFKRDSEFLRFPADLDVPQVDGLTKLGSSGDRYNLISAESIQKTSFSLLRALGPTYTRIREKEVPRITDNAEEGSAITTLLFPLSEKRALGSIRSGRIANDIAYSFVSPQDISKIFERLEGIPAVPTTGGIISIGEDGNTNGAIPIEDWLENQPLFPLGLSDAMAELSSYGFMDQELNVVQQEVLVKKIDSYRALMKQYIIELRDTMVKLLSQQTMEDKSFLQGEAYDNLFESLEGEPLIAGIMKELQNSLPLYKKNDIAMVAGITQVSADLFMKTMAQVPGPLGKERNRRVRDQYLQALANALMKSDINSLNVFVPQPNTCPHVKDLKTIRKQRDDVVQMKLFAKFLTRYEGQKNGNWVDCSVCKEHLVCYHDVLLLKEFLHPKEKDVLHKELLLAFSGGQFHGKYICKNCGQGISELEFDTSVEFSDDGAPMSGREILEQEVDLSNIVDAILGPITNEEKQEEVTYVGDQLTIYTAAKKLFGIVGIQAKPEVYPRIIERVMSDLTKQPTREQYIKMYKGKQVPDYKIYINRILVSSLAIHCLVEIQTDVPGYILRYKIPGCRAGFSGFPVGDDKDRTGLEYIVCAISAIHDNVAPWDSTGFLAQKDDKKRQEIVLKSINLLLDSVLNNVNIQQQILAKRAFLEKVYGVATYADQLPERIPEGFRPFPYVVSGAAAVNSQVVSEAATPRERIRGWVASAHQLGKDNGSYVKGSPLSDSTCCPMPIQEPGKFWREQGNVLPSLPLKEPPRGPVNSHLTVHFKPRASTLLETSVAPDAMYKIFLKVCYDGPRKGLPHEPGYTNVCLHCKFIFPYNPYEARPIPPFSAQSMKTYREEVETVIMEGQRALKTQNIAVNVNTFESVLDASHKAFHVDPHVQKKPPAGMELFELFTKLKPEPFENWSAMINETLARVRTLPPGAERIEVANAYGEISNYAVEVIEKIKRRIGEENGQILQSILEDASATETIRTYIVVPLQRLIVGFQTKSLKVPKEYDLGQAITEDINANLEQHLKFLENLSDRVKGITKEKMIWTRSRLSEAITLIQNNIRGAYIPGGESGLKYVITALIGGILVDFVDPDYVPPGVFVEGRTEGDPRAAIHILDICINKIGKEGLRFTDDQIRELIRQRDEKEKMLFIGRFENKNSQEKYMEKMFEKLGLGEYSVGGTKAIYAYNEEQYDRERVQRLEMGFTEIVDTGGGYDNAQVQEDDY